MLLEVTAQRLRVGTNESACDRVTTLLTEAGEFLQHDDRPAEPNALAASLSAYAVHAIVPIARPHQRQTMSAESPAVLDGTQAMFQDRGSLLGDLRDAIIFMLLGGQLRPFQKAEPVHRAKHNRRSSPHNDNRERQPQIIVGNAQCTRPLRSADATNVARPLA